MSLAKKGFKITVIYGVISGLFLAALLKLVELTTRLKVYTLLLNVDYIPFVNTVAFPELIELVFHLIVSIALAVSLYLLIIYRKIQNEKQLILICTAVCFIIGAALFPTTAFSDRTPVSTSMPSFAYWIAGHILYGYLLGVLFARQLNQWKVRF